MYLHTPIPNPHVYNTIVSSSCTTYSVYIYIYIYIHSSSSSFSFFLVLLQVIPREHNRSSWVLVKAGAFPVAMMISSSTPCCRVPGSAHRKQTLRCNLPASQPARRAGRQLVTCVVFPPCLFSFLVAVVARPSVVGSSARKQALRG